jgi:hypothetical protein
MNWKFWSKNEKTEGGTSHSKSVKRTKPIQLPSEVGRHLVVDLQQEPDWVWRLRAVTSPKEEGGQTFWLRVFDPDTANARAFHHLTFEALNEHPDLVLFEGWYDKKTRKVELKPAEAERAA